MEKICLLLKLVIYSVFDHKFHLVAILQNPIIIFYSSFENCSNIFFYLLNSKVLTHAGGHRRMVSEVEFYFPKNYRASKRFAVQIFEFHMEPLECLTPYSYLVPSNFE